MRHHLACLLGAAVAAASPAAAQTGAQTAGPSAAERGMNSIPVVPPEVIDELVRRLGAAAEANERATNPERAAPVNRYLPVSLAPNKAAHVINTVRGYITTITVVDATGQPWPIQAFVSSNAHQPASVDCQSAAPGATSGALNAAAAYETGFDVCAPVKGGNSLVVTTRSKSPRGNLKLFLEGADAPVSVVLVAGSGSFDDNLTMKVVQRGPKARVETYTAREFAGGLETGDVTLTSFLDGAPPAEARPLGVTGVSPDRVQAWRLGRVAYVRTPDLIVSPQPNARERSPGGDWVYRIPYSPSVIASSRDGVTYSITLQERGR